MSAAPSPHDAPWRARFSLTQKVFAFALVIGAGTWYGVDHLLSRDLEALFMDSMQQELESHAARDRREFDRRLQAHHRAVRLITAQERFLQALRQVDWSEPAGAPLQHQRPPPWMPTPAVLRSFYGARFAILLDARGQAREVYRTLPTALPTALLRPTSLLQKLSHTESYLTELDGIPYAVAGQSFRVGETRGTLLLASPIDAEFLGRVVAGAAAQQAVALLYGHPRRVVSSSTPEAAPRGLTLAELQQRFLVTGKSFFDYGAADLDAQFVSLLPRSRARQQLASVLRSEQYRRTLLSGALILPFLFLTYWIARRIRQLAVRIDEIARATLGGQHAHRPLRGDELNGLMDRFRAFTDELVEARDALREEVTEKLRLERAAVLAEQQVSHLEELRAVTDAMQVGVILDGPGGPRPANATMEQLAADCGGFEQFAANTALDSVLVTLRDLEGRERVFRVRRPGGAGEGTLLVREITAQVELERERRLFTCLPAENPNPILRVDSGGRIRYANRASMPLLAAWGVAVDDPLPEPLAGRLQASEANDGGSVELPVSERTYAFFPARVEDADFAYLYGYDVTARREAEAAVEALNRRLEEHVQELTRVNRDLESFSYSVSHDLQEPLRAIDGFSHLLLEDHGADLSEDARRYLDRVRQSAGRMAKLIDGLLRLSRLSRTRLQPESVDLTALARESIEPLRERDPERTVEVAIEDDLTVQGDANLLKAALENLLGNAWKFTAPRATAHIAFGRCHDEAVPTFYIRDNGIGFDMHDAPRLFEAFQRIHDAGRFPGSGIGLATVARIIERHGGRIWAEAEPEAGATFYFTLSPEPADVREPAVAAGGAR